MLNITEQRVAKGLFRLLRAPADVDRWDAHLVARDEVAASGDHQELFRRYLEESRATTQRAIAAWLGELHGWAAENRTSDAADKEMWATYPAGPAAQPFFVAMVRNYWLACDTLNRKVPEVLAVPPEHFMLGWLQALGDRTEQVRVLACMPYWPLGIDAKGRWI